jgi:hypothetical protein
MEDRKIFSFNLEKGLQHRSLTQLLITKILAAYEIPGRHIWDTQNIFTVVKRYVLLGNPDFVTDITKCFWFWQAVYKQCIYGGRIAYCSEILLTFLKKDSVKHESFRQT